MSEGQGQGVNNDQLQQQEVDCDRDKAGNMEMETNNETSASSKEDIVTSGITNNCQEQEDKLTIAKEINDGNDTYIGGEKLNDQLASSSSSSTNCKKESDDKQEPSTSMAMAVDNDTTNNPVPSTSTSSPISAITEFNKFALNQIKKMSNNLQKRNYRKSSGIPGAGSSSGAGDGESTKVNYNSSSSDDDDDGIDAKRPNTNTNKEPANPSPSEPISGEVPVPSSPLPELEPEINEHSPGADRLYPIFDEEGRLNPRIFHDAIGDDDDGDEDINEHEELEDILSTSSNDTSDQEAIDMDNESSSDSDSYLEDIDDPPPLHPNTNPSQNENDDQTATTSTGAGAAASGVTNKTNKKDTTDKNKTKKVFKNKPELPKVLLKPKPKYNWNGPMEIFQRELGYRGNVQPQSAEIFRSRFYGCLFSAERLELMTKLDGHKGCVNCLNFNVSGTKLISGSDDLYIKIWNYGLGKQIASFQSGHRSNVFQAKFLPMIGLDTLIVTCARDNQVKLTELSSSGSVASSRKLATHKGAVHKLSVSLENPHVILSCGEDSFVYSMDIREEKPKKILNLRENGKKIALYSISSNPQVSHEFCTAGRDEYVRIYDIRALGSASVPLGSNSNNDLDESMDSISESNEPVKKFCPHHLIDTQSKPNITSAVYNYNGREIVASYNDENIYLFDTSHSDKADCIKVYEGHRNSATVKGVNFFGDRSQFVISGSDCGHIFFWDKETEAIVNFLRGDENGVVNCLEPNPLSPILATSGLDNDIKIWIPSNEKRPALGDLASTVRKNLKKRISDLERMPDLDGQVMFAIWSHLRNADRERRREAGITNGSDSDSWTDEEEDPDGEPPMRVDCSIV